MANRSEQINFGKTYAIKAGDKMIFLNNTNLVQRPAWMQINSSLEEDEMSKEECIDVDIFGTINKELPCVFLSNIKQQGKERFAMATIQNKIIVKNNSDKDIIICFGL